jgi:iron complex transport system ATP-binding protein
MEAIELKNLNFSYPLNSFELKDISFSCDDKKIIGLAGPNGSGKSTLLKLIAGLEKPKNGEIFLKGKKLENYKAIERAKIIRWVGQEEITKNNYKVLEYLLLGGFPNYGFFGRYSKNDLMKAEEILEYFYLKNKKDWLVENLSGGEKKLLKIGFCLISDPKIILLDEPFSHLDPIHLKNLFKIIKKEKEDGKTFIISSHEYNILRAISDYLLLLSEGEKICFDEPQRIDLSLWEKTFKVSFFEKKQEQIIPDIF